MEAKKLRYHIKFLQDEVFFVNTKWPHFELLFKDIKRLSESKKIKNVISLERGSLYGNISLFAPYFFKHNFKSIDCSTKNILSRGSYNKKYVQNEKIIKIPITKHCDYRRISLPKNSADLIIIPNLMHHIFDHEILLKQCKKILNSNGILYIFEPTIREIHQAPDDYFRFTPYSLKKILRKIGFNKLNHNFCGGPFTAAAYCLDQALQYVPDNKKSVFKKKFYNSDINAYLKYEKNYKKNLHRKNTIFPMSFSVTATV